MVLQLAAISAAAVTLLAGQALAEPLPTSHLSFNGPFEVERDGIQNINVVYNRDLNGELTLAYGDCDIQTRQNAAHRVGSTHIGAHPLAKRHAEWKDSRPAKFVWRAPADIEQGCLHAFVGEELVGRSQEYTVKNRKIKKRATFADVSDPMGPWFDGVEYLKQKNPNETFVAATKEKKFGILGGGISGLTTALILESVGIHNWKILESSGRLGGRMRTAYLNNTAPEDYQYHELGPMRFPYTITDPETNETFAIEDQKMIFQLADILNEMNKDEDPALQVTFAPWIQTSANTPVATTKRRPDGTVPGRLETQLDPSLLDNPNSTYSNVTAVYEAMAALDDFKALTPERARFYAKDIFRAHKQAVEQGMLDFSEVEYLRYAMGYDANITDQVTTTAISWPMWEFETVYFMADKWLTIDKGMSRLPEAFHPLVDSRRALRSQK